MPTRNATAHWEGTIRDGKGTVALGSGAFEGPYSFHSRFSEEGGTGTNPEELIGAASAGCFSMFLSGVLTKAGHTPERIDTTAQVTIRQEEGGPVIPSIALTTEAEVPGISEDEFLKAAQDAKANCPVSKALAAVDISLDARLVS